MKHNIRKGVTLIELAVVLVIVGLLIGIAFKGFDLLRSSSVTAEANKIQKITGAVASFKSTYKRLPGDGCSGTITELCSGGDADGDLEDTHTLVTELVNFWEELYLAGLISAADRVSEISTTGENYTVDEDVSSGHKGVYITLTSANEELMCQLDQNHGDGIDDASKQDSGFMCSGCTSYTASTDCTTLTQAGKAAEFLVFKN